MATYFDEQFNVRIHYDATESDQHKTGIHLLDASNDELDRALEDAERDLFTDIYLH